MQAFNEVSSKDVSRFLKFDAGSNTPARGAEGTAADFQATASAADLSSIRCSDVMMHYESCRVAVWLDVACYLLFMDFIDFDDFSYWRHKVLGPGTTLRRDNLLPL